MLNDTLTIYQLTEEQSTSTGGVKHNFAAGATVRCRVQAVSSFESVQNKVDTGAVQYKIYILPGADVNIDDRVKWNGLDLDVRSVQTDHSGKGPYRMILAEYRTSGLIK